MTTTRNDGGLRGRARRFVTGVVPVIALFVLFMAYMADVLLVSSEPPAAVALAWGVLVALVLAIIYAGVFIDAWGLDESPPRQHPERNRKEYENANRGVRETRFFVGVCGVRRVEGDDRAESDG